MSHNTLIIHQFNFSSHVRALARETRLCSPSNKSLFYCSIKQLPWPPYHACRKQISLVNYSVGIKPFCNICAESVSNRHAGILEMNGHLKQLVFAISLLSYTLTFLNNHKIQWMFLWVFLSYSTVMLDSRWLDATLNIRSYFAGQFSSFHNLCVLRYQSFVTSMTLLMRKLASSFLYRLWHLSQFGFISYGLTTKPLSQWFVQRPPDFSFVPRSRPWRYY